LLVFIDIVFVDIIVVSIVRASNNLWRSFC